MALLQALSFEGLMDLLKRVLQELPDRRTGNNCRYSMRDAALGAFAVFFTQSASFLAFQKGLAKAKGQSNAQTLFGMEAIPCDNHIRTLLDEVPPAQLFAVFPAVEAGLHADGRLEALRGVNDQLLIALDGVEYFSSQKISCAHCTHRTQRNGTTTYSHQMITPVIVAPGQDKVIPLIPEFITPQDGQDKQDCETAAAKRWLAQHGAHYRQLRATVLGDDLYSRQPLCEAILAAGFHFILVCKPDSHPTLYDWLAGLSVPTRVVRRWTGRGHLTDTYRYVNDLPVRDGDDALLVNWCELTTTRDDGTAVYHNSFITDWRLNAANVKAIVRAGRTRWKVENENNNVLKTKGYHFEHNYGHGKHYLAAVLATLILLAFLFHTVLEWVDQRYQLLRQHLPSRQTFFDDLRALTRYLCFASWTALLSFMIAGLELEAPDTG